ncbi:MAG: calcium-binding protein [Hyphomicrobium sp.]
MAAASIRKLKVISAGADAALLLDATQDDAHSALSAEGALVAGDADLSDDLIDGLSDGLSGTSEAELAAALFEATGTSEGGNDEAGIVMAGSEAEAHASADDLGIPANPDGRESVLGIDAGQIIRGGDGADWLMGGAGDDILYFDAADLFVSGGEGYDVAYMTDVTGGYISIGNLGLEEVHGGGGDDTIDAHHAIQSVSAFGGAGNDCIVGGRKSDVIDGGTGNDTLTGGAGSDTFAFGAMDTATDTITDFAAGDDIISFAGAGRAYDDLAFAQMETGALVAAGGHTILLAGVSVASLSAQSFLF